MTAIDLVGVMHSKAACPALAMLDVSCLVDNTTTEQVGAPRTSGLAHLRVVKFMPVRPVPGGPVPGATTSEEARQWAYENRIACGDVKYGYSYLRCRGVEANELGLAGPPVSELWFSFGSNGHLIGVDVYRRGTSANDTTAAWDGARHAPRDALGMPTSTMGSAPPVALSTSPLQTSRLQRRFFDYVAIATASNLPYAGLVVREQYMSFRL